MKSRIRCVVNWSQVVTIRGLYFKPMTIVNDDSRVINKLEGSLTDDTSVIIYDRHMFIVKATDVKVIKCSCLPLHYKKT
jgi:hypothetical protein